MSMKIAFAFLVMAGTTIISGCSRETSTAKRPEPKEVKNVAIAKVTRSTIEDFYEASGTVQARSTTQVSANMMGRIVSIPVVEGDVVRRGQTLVEIDNSESKTRMLKAEGALKEAQASIAEIDRSVEGAVAASRSAEAARQLARVTFDRYKELYERRSASAQEFDEAQSRLRSANAEVERARANITAIQSKKAQVNARIEQAKAEIANTRVYEGYSRIVSPVSGIVVKKLAEAGATATPGTPLLSIEDNSRYRLEANVE
jgi:multidrug resistance efflux pump